jgi:hypothetical protein
VTTKDLKTVSVKIFGKTYPFIKGKNGVYSATMTAPAQAGTYTYVITNQYAKSKQTETNKLIVAVPPLSLSGDTSYSKLSTTDSKTTASLLSHPRTILNRVWQLTPGTYTLTINGRTQGPGSAQVKVSVNGKPVQTVTLGQTYTTKTIGRPTQRNGTVKVQLQFLNDLFTCTPQQLALHQTLNCDRNALIHSINMVQGK